MSIDDQISTLRPQSGDVVVYTIAAPEMPHGELWALQERLKKTFPDNRSAVVMGAQVGLRFQAFTDAELVMLGVGPYQITRHGVGATEAARLHAEIVAELERRKKP